MTKSIFHTFLVCSLAFSSASAQSVLEWYPIVGPRIDYINKPWFGVRLSASMDAYEYTLTPVSFAFFKSDLDNAFRCSHNVVLLIPAVVTYSVFRVPVEHSYLGIYMLVLLPQLLPNFRYQQDIFKKTVYITVGQNTDYFITDKLTIYSETMLGLKIRHRIGSLELYGALPWTKGFFANRHPYCSLTAHIALFRNN